MVIWGKAPEGEETLRIVHVRKISCVYKTWYQSENIDYRCYTQICVENVRLQIFCEFTNERYDVSRTMWSRIHCAWIRNNECGITYGPIPLKPYSLLAIMFLLAYSSCQLPCITSGQERFLFVLKKHSGCCRALFTFKETTKYFIKKVYCTFVDASKAFDKVLNNGLFVKLIKTRT